MEIEKSREAFESRRIPNLNLERSEDGSYRYPAAQMAFRDIRHRDARWHDDELVMQVLAENTRMIQSSSVEREAGDAVDVVEAMVQAAVGRPKICPTVINRNGPRIIGLRKDMEAALDALLKRFELRRRP